ncbi:MAG TPA: recombinase RecA [Clostridiales bacterium]|jgi:recombination protein RecA|nr:recombinase RecA [Clostridiales bacterium]
MAQKKIKAVAPEKASGGEKKKAIDTAINQIVKKYGSGSIMKLGQNQNMQMNVIPTGSLSLDIALGVGGVPRGRIVEIYGPESSGKTTVALHIVAEVQKMGGEAAFIDAEHALDPLYAKAVGVDIDNLLVSQPDDGEQALQITEELVRSDAIDVLVVDSVAALTPRAEIEGDMGAATMGAQARLMSQALRKLSGVVAKSQCVLIFINQLRDKVGVVYGSPEVTTGGRALRFYASVRLDVRRAEQLKNKSDVVGHHVKCKVAKNKVAPPFRVAEFDIMYGEGISKESELIDIGILLGMVEKSGAWLSVDGMKIGQGKENARLYLKSNPALAKTLEERILEKSKELSEQNQEGAPVSEDEIDDELDLVDEE